MHLACTVSPMRRGVGAVCLTAGLLLLVAACGDPASSNSLSATTTSTTAAAPGATVSTTTTAAGDSSTTSTTSASSSPFLAAPGRVVFLSPSGNISCEIDYTSGATTNAAICQTLSPAESASLSPDGSVKTCGLGCEGNPAVHTPTLDYGSSTGLGPFECRSATSGVTCTVSGKGFEISRSGISSVGAPQVNLAPGSYSGNVETVDPGASQMTFAISSTGCNGVPSSGTWSVDLTGATFVTNSTLTTEQGQAVTLTPSQWAQEVTSHPEWTLVVASGQPLEVTNGPSC